MNKINIEWNDNVTDIVIKLGGIGVFERPGFYSFKNKVVDLTASGEEVWQVAKNVINQLI